MSNVSDPSRTLEFRPLGRFVSIYEPKDAAEGQLVILATWLGSKTQHIAKYVTLYKRLAPNAKILLIRASVDGFLWPYSIQKRNIRPALDPIAGVLKECGDNNDDVVGNPLTKARPHILLQIFSNGGANNVLKLLHVWKSEMGIPLPISGLIIDSAIGAGGYKQNSHAFQ